MSESKTTVVQQFEDGAQVPQEGFAAFSGGGGGSVESVTGTAPIAVNNTDPSNPVVSLGNITLAGDVTGNQGTTRVVGAVTRALLFEAISAAVSGHNFTGWNFNEGNFGTYFANGVPSNGDLVTGDSATLINVATGDMYGTGDNGTTWAAKNSLSSFTGATSASNFFGMRVGSTALYFCSGSVASGDLLPTGVTHAYALNAITQGVYVTSNGGTLWGIA